MAFFDHEKLDVYRTSLEFILLVDDILNNLPVGKAYLGDQLKRASSSVTLNIAEGAGEFSKAEKIRFYRIAKRSATECASILDVCHCLNAIEESLHLKSRDYLLRIVSMLIKMSK